MCNVQRATCNVQRAICQVQRATCNVQRATCTMQRATCNVQRATCDLQRATCNVQRATCPFGFVSAGAATVRVVAGAGAYKANPGSGAPPWTARFRHSRNKRVACALCPVVAGASSIVGLVTASSNAASPRSQRATYGDRHQTERRTKALNKSPLSCRPACAQGASLPGRGTCKLQAASCQLQAASCKLQAASCKLQAASCKLQAASCKLQAASCKLQAARCKLQLKLCWGWDARPVNRVATGLGQTATKSHRNTKKEEGL